MGKHNKRSRRFFPVIDSRIAEHSIDPMTEVIGEATIESMDSMATGGRRMMATEVRDLKYGQKDAVSASESGKEQVSQNTREERARKNGHKPSRAKKMQQTYARDRRSVNPIPRIR